MWRDHPRGTYVLCLIEFLERSSYYGMRALLVLLMIAPAASGGLGWPEASTLAFYGVFTGAVWCSPILGGLVADRWLGMRAAVTGGGILLLAGYVTLMVAIAMPQFFHVTSALSLRELSVLTGVPLGQWPTTLQLATMPAGVSMASVTVGLRLEATLFVGALALIAMGNAFFKPSITLMVGESYRDDDPARERAYLLFYMSVYAAVLVAGVGIGSLAENFGWTIGVAGAVISMAAALVTFRRMRERPGSAASAGQSIAGPEGGNSRPLVSAVAFIGIHSLFAMVFWAAYEQSGGLVSIFISQSVDRHIGSWEVPVTWFYSLTAAFAIGTGPLLPKAVAAWERRRGNLEISDRFAVGLAAGAAAFAVLSAGSSQAHNGTVSILWPIVFYGLLTLGELLFSPTGFSMIGRFAPRRHQSALMGLWLLSVALGSFLGGQIGAASTSIGRTTAFVGLAISLGFAAVVIHLLRKRLHDAIPEAGTATE